MSESIQKLVIVSSAQTRCDNINGQNGRDSHENVFLVFKLVNNRSSKGHHWLTIQLKSENTKFSFKFLFDSTHFL